MSRTAATDGMASIRKETPRAKSCTGGPLMQNPGVKDSTLDAIGNTPVVRLTRMPPSGAATVLVKLEYYNPTGSYKDRMALAMISEAERRGDLRPGMTVIEYTGGSTGSSLALVCAVKGYKFQVVSSDAFAPEKLATMRAFGADVMIEPSRGGQITPDLLPRMMDRVRTLATQVSCYRTDQLNNADSIKGYEGIGRELAEQVNGNIDVFCGGVGTAGMLVGVANVLKPLGTRVVALEPATSRESESASNPRCWTAGPTTKSAPWTSNSHAKPPGAWPARRESSEVPRPA